MPWKTIKNFIQAFIKVIEVQEKQKHNHAIKQQINDRAEVQICLIALGCKSEGVGVLCVCVCVGLMDGIEINSI